jgi:serine phosphatase RsbU (regulator of sigma subunit)
MKGLGLSFKLFLIFGLILILAISGSFIIITNTVSQKVRNQIELRGISLAFFLSSQAVEAYLQEDDLTLVSLTASLKRSNPGVISAVVTDGNGKIVSHSDSILLRGKAYDLKVSRPYRTVFDSISNLKAEIYESERGIVFVSQMFDRIRKREIGKVFLTLSKRDIDEARRNILFILGATAFITIVLGLLATMLFTNLLTKNIGILLEDMRVIGEGNLEHKVRVSSNDEIGIIARAVENMAVKLKEVQDRLLETEKFRQEVELARRIQSALLPRVIPKLEGFEIAVTFQPALLVGGDYYDFFRMRDGKVGFLVADVSGKGVAGSLVVVMFRSVIHSESPIFSSPKELLLRVHESLMGEIPEDMYITTCMGAIKGRSITLASAGHNPPILYRASMGKAFMLEMKGVPLGLSVLSLEDVDKNLEEYPLELEKGDVLILYSDGITEAENFRKDQFGEDRLLKIAESLAKSEYPAEKIKGGILEAVKDFVGGTPQSDDITLLVIKCVG